MFRHDLKTYNTDYVDGKEDTTYLAIYLKVFQLGAVWTVFTAKRAPSNEFILQFLNQSSYAAYLLMRQTPSSDTTHKAQCHFSMNRHRDEFEQDQSTTVASCGQV